MSWSIERSQPPRRGRFWWLVMVSGLLAWTALAVSMDNGHLGVFQDDGLYLSSARSLRDGQGFGLPGRPMQPPPKYPIGLPAVIALALKLDPDPGNLGREVAIARGVVLVGAWAFFLTAFAWLGRVGVGPGLSSGIVLATAFHHIVLVGGATTIFSDLPFAAISWILIYRWAGRSPSLVEGATRRAFLDGAIAGFGVLVRTNGVTLVLAALVAAALARRGWSSLLACLAGASLVVAPASRYAGLHPRVVPSNNYLLEMKAGWSSPEAGWRVLTTNLGSLISEFPSRVLASPANYSAPILKVLTTWPRLDLGFRLGVSIVVGIGLVRLARRSRRLDVPAWVYAVGSMGIFAIWPWNSIMDRLLLSLIPMVILAFVQGLEAIAIKVGLGRAGRRRVVAVALVGVILASSGVTFRAAWVFHSQGRQWPGASHRASLDQALGLIRDRTEPDAVIAAFWPEMVYLHTGRLVFPLVEDEAFLIRRYGDLARFKHWRSLVPGRPLYVLARGENEEGAYSEADLPQLLAIEQDLSFEVHEVARTSDGRYRLSRVSSSTLGSR